MGFFKQLLLLLWKNFLTQKRQIVWTFFELAIPLLFTTIFVGMRQTVDSVDMGVTNYDPYHVTGTWLDFWQVVDDAPMVSHLQFHDNQSANYCSVFNPRNVFYTPQTDLTQALMDIVHLRTGLTVTGFPNEDEMVNNLTNLFNSLPKCNNTYLGGIVFDNFTLGETNVTNRVVTYAIRLSNTQRNKNTLQNTTSKFLNLNVNQGWNTGLEYPIVPNLGPRENISSSGGRPGYWREGFLTLQKAVDAAILTVITYGLNSSNWPIAECKESFAPPNSFHVQVLEYFLCAKYKNVLNRSLCDHVHAPVITRKCADWLVNDTWDASVLLQRFPYPPYLNNPYIGVIQHNLPILIMLSYVISALYIIRYCTVEKEKRLKEYMRVMGMSNFVQWTSYFVINMVKLLVSVLYMSIMLTVSINGKRVMDKSSWSVVFVFLFIYSICTVCYCFAVSVFFKKGNTAAAFGGVMWFAIYVPYFFLQPRYASLKRSWKFSSSLFFTTAMSFGAQIIGSYEGEGVGIHWDNINKPATMGDNFTMLDVFCMLLVDALICLLITWYVEAVFPGDEGVAQPFYFPFKITYWCPSFKKTEINLNSLDQTIDKRIVDKVEPYPLRIEPQVVISRLSKEFGRGRKRKVAVDKLTLNMYPGQTTVLLGHNGAGKSTTMSMLTGMMSPTSGTAVLNECDIRNGLSNARKYLGLCPQYNPLFDNLTVMEHVKFFCMLKSRPLNLGEVHRYFECLGLMTKQNCLAKNLSGGMKRKLCLAIALVGGSEIVMLDEPTSGMDPSARHEAWHLLQKEKHGRTILLTTHYMEEADLLGDRIAVLSHGQLQCFGSSLFLKHIYGAGYHLTAVFKIVDNNDSFDNVEKRAQTVLSIIRDQAPTAKLESATGAEASFLLPTEHRERYRQLFANLERHQQHLAVTSFGVSVTTMEEVFLKVTKDADEQFYSQMEKIQEPKNLKNLRFDSEHVVTGWALYVNQFKALLVKRALHSFRNWLVLIAQLVMPVILLITAILINKLMPGPGAQPSLPLTLSKFQTQQYVGVYNWSNVTNDLNVWYQTVVNNLNPTNKFSFPVIPDDDLDAYVLAESQTYGENNFDLNHVIGAAFESASYDVHESDRIVQTIDLPRISAYFNNQPYHGPGISLAAVDNALLAAATNGTYSILARNHPLPPSNTDQLEDWIATGVVEFNLALFLMFGMSFLSSSFVVLLIKERVTKAKHLQLLGGLPSFVFWLSSFVWDYLNYMLTVALLLIVMVAFDISALISGTGWLHMLLLFVLYGWAVLPMTYCFSFAFSSPASGFVMMTIFNILSGIATYSITSVFLALGLTHVYKILHWVFQVLFPTYCLGESIDSYYFNSFFLSSCESYEEMCTLHAAEMNGFICCKKGLYTTDYLQWTNPGIGNMLFCLALQGFVSVLLLVLIELDVLRHVSYFFQKFGLKLQSKYAKGVEPSNLGGRRQSRSTVDSIRASTVNLDETSELEDPDVSLESEVAAKVRFTQVPLVAYGLTKYYGKFLAVNKVNFVVRNGECFGLLGVNGAGKTTTFQMLTGENRLTDGDAYIAGLSIKRNWKQAGKKIGYCPQFDALIDQLTGREMLVMFARLKGVPERDIRDIVRNVITAVGIAEHANKQVQTYSGGTKRKLSLGIALIGEPKVLLLDEPTSGVDPVSRRFIWSILSQLRERKVAIVLTSHSMEECEALCTRLAIMVDGKFKCLGSSQHLKSTRGNGYTLLIKLANESHYENAVKTIERTFPGSELKEVHNCQLHYEIRVAADRNWSSLFGALENLVAPLHIIDYSLSQTTLEQIFLDFLIKQNSNLATTSLSPTTPLYEEIGLGSSKF